MTFAYNIIFQHLFFFLVGVFQDLVITYYLEKVNKKQAWRAGISSAAVTLINLVVLYEILVDIEDQVMSIVLAYSIGCGAGTIIIIKKRQIITSVKRILQKK